MQRQQRRRIETTYAPLPDVVMLGRKSNKQYADHRQGADWRLGSIAVQFEFNLARQCRQGKKYPRKPYRHVCAAARIHLECGIHRQLTHQSCRYRFSPTSADSTPLRRCTSSLAFTIRSKQAGSNNLQTTQLVIGFRRPFVPNKSTILQTMQVVTGFRHPFAVDHEGPLV